MGKSGDHEESGNSGDKEGERAARGVCPLLKQEWYARFIERMACPLVAARVATKSGRMPSPL